MELAVALELQLRNIQMAKVSVHRQAVAKKTPELAPGWHRVTLSYNPWMAYFQSIRGGENKHDSVTDWLKANVRKGQWVYVGYYGGSVFDLKNESDAVQLSLIWGG